MALSRHTESIKRLLKNRQMPVGIRSDFIRGQRVSVCLSVCPSVKKRESILKYRNQTTLTGAPKFVPLVFEHFWDWGNEVDKFLDELSKKSVDTEGK